MATTFDMATTFLIWQPPSSYGKHLPHMVTTLLVWQKAKTKKNKGTAVEGWDFVSSHAIMQEYVDAHANILSVV